MASTLISKPRHGKMYLAKHRFCNDDEVTMELKIKSSNLILCSNNVIQWISLRKIIFLLNLNANLAMTCPHNGFLLSA